MRAGSLAVCLSVPAGPADCPKSLLRGSNPGKPRKAEMGGGRDEAIKKKGFLGILLAHLDFLLFDGSSPAHRGAASASATPVGQAVGLEKRALSGGDLEGKSNRVSAPWDQSSCLHQPRWSKGDAVPPKAMTGSGGILQLGDQTCLGPMPWHTTVLLSYTDGSNQVFSFPVEANT